MNTIVMNGRAVGAPKDGVTQSGTPKTTFTVETDGGELPLRFSCIAFGPCAERAVELADGNEILLTGRMTASAYSRAMTVVVNGLEILGGNNGKHSG